MFHHSAVRKPHAFKLIADPGGQRTHSSAWLAVSGWFAEAAVMS
jgi:hypothetical protein